MVVVLLLEVPIDCLGFYQRVLRRRISYLDISMECSIRSQLIPLSVVKVAQCAG